MELRWKIERGNRFERGTSPHSCRNNEPPLSNLWFPPMSKGIMTYLSPPSLSISSLSLSLSLSLHIAFERCLNKPFNFFLSLSLEISVRVSVVFVYVGVYHQMKFVFVYAGGSHQMKWTKCIIVAYQHLLLKIKQFTFKRMKERVARHLLATMI